MRSVGFGLAILTLRGAICFAVFGKVKVGVGNSEGINWSALSNILDRFFLMVDFNLYSWDGNLLLALKELNPG